MIKGLRFKGLPTEGGGAAGEKFIFCPQRTAEPQFKVQGSKFKGAHRGRRSRSSRFKVQRVFHTDSTDLTDEAAELPVQSYVLPAMIFVTTQPIKQV